MLRLFQISFITIIWALMFLGLEMLLYEPDIVLAQGPSTFDDTTLYFRRSVGGQCELTDSNNPNYNGTMQDFITYSLPYEWHPASELEAYKAGAVAIRTFVLNPRNHTQINVSGQTYRCVSAFKVQGFDPSPPSNQTPDLFPLSGQAINETNGLYMTHPQAKNVEDLINPVLNSQGAIDAQFRAETGNPTAVSTDTNDSQYLRSVSDPISPSLPSDKGMGQNGSSRWAVGKSVFTDTTASPDFPQWNYRQILAHYYTEIQIVQDDGSGNLSTLTPEYRWNPIGVVWLFGGGVLPPPNMTPGNSYQVQIWMQNTGVITYSTPDLRIAYQWQELDGTIVSQGNWINSIFVTPPGEDNVYQSPVQTPATSGIYALLIDMQVQNGGSYEYFYNREPGRPWYPLEYICEIGSNGSQCYFSQDFAGSGGIYLPIILKNAS